MTSTTMAVHRNDPNSSKTSDGGHGKMDDYPQRMNSHGSNSSSDSSTMHSNHMNNTATGNKGPTKDTWRPPCATAEDNRNFFMYKYNCEACSMRRSCPNKVTCPGWHHEGEKRRNPGVGPHFRYSEEPCLQVKPQGVTKWLPPSRCMNGDGCQYSHTLLEQMYHPNIYKTSMCINFTHPSGNKCQWGYYCTHAHGQEDIRNPKKISLTNNPNNPNMRKSNKNQSQSHRPRAQSGPILPDNLRQLFHSVSKGVTTLGKQISSIMEGSSSQQQSSEKASKSSNRGDSNAQQQAQGNNYIQQQTGGYPPTLNADLYHQHQKQQHQQRIAYAMYANQMYNAQQQFSQQQQPNAQYGQYYHPYHPDMAHGHTQSHTHGHGPHPYHRSNSAHRATRGRSVSDPPKYLRDWRSEGDFSYLLQSPPEPQPPPRLPEIAALGPPTQNASKSASSLRARAQQEMENPAMAHLITDDRSGTPIRAIPKTISADQVSKLAALQQHAHANTDPRIAHSQSMNFHALQQQQSLGSTSSTASAAHPKSNERVPSSARGNPQQVTVTSASGATTNVTATAPSGGGGRSRHVRKRSGSEPTLPMMYWNNPRHAQREQLPTYYEYPSALHKSRSDEHNRSEAQAQQQTHPHSRGGRPEPQNPKFASPVLAGLFGFQTNEFSALSPRNTLQIPNTPSPPLTHPQNSMDTKRSRSLEMDPSMSDEAGQGGVTRGRKRKLSKDNIAYSNAEIRAILKENEELKEQIRAQVKEQSENSQAVVVEDNKIVPSPEVQNQLDRLHSFLTCPACQTMEYARDCVLVPCGHLICGSCSPNFKDCPQCGRTVESIVQLQV